MNIINKCFIALFFLFLVSPTFALYELSPNLIYEYKDLKSKYQASPSSNQACFDFAMVCAYTGDIEYGFSILKKVDISYADVVVSQHITLIEANSLEWRYYFKIAFGYYFKQRYDDAIFSFKEVLKIDPNHIWAMAFISLIYQQQGDYEECLHWALKALKLEPDAAALNFLVANAYKSQGKYFKSAAYFLTCIRLRAAENNYRSSIYE